MPLYAENITRLQQRSRKSFRRAVNSSAVLAAPMPLVDTSPADTDVQSGERIAKLLARAGVASRRKIERMVADGRVALNGIMIDTPATTLRSLDGVTVDGAPVAQAEPARLFLYHKPTGLLVTEHDPRGRPTIYDRLPRDLPRLVPVGRLDLNTEGLLLLTTDGELKRQLELPSSGVERSYRARAYGPISQPQLEELIDGVEIDGVRYGSIDANLERRTGANSWIELTLTEGKNREVRRVLEHLGLQVGRLIRTRYGPFILADLPPGEIGEVRAADLVAFRQTLTTKAKNDARIAIPSATAPRRGEGERRPARGAGGVASSRPVAGQTSLARPRPTTPQRSVASRQHPDAHAGEGRSPVAARPVAKAAPRPRAPASLVADEKRAAPTGKPFKWRGAAPAQNTPQPDPALRWGGATDRSGSNQRARSTQQPATSSPSRAHSSTPQIEPTPRPAKPQRKAGWAKPKPKSAPPRRPGKPK